VEYGVRWRFHTRAEKLFMQSGTLQIEIRGAPKQTAWPVEINCKLIDLKTSIVLQ
jgi:hypothetical protein